MSEKSRGEIRIRRDLPSFYAPDLRRLVETNRIATGSL
jgi:hypothetical protein